MKINSRELAKLGLAYLVATGTGYLFYVLNVPLPWMIGPLIATAILVFSGLLKVTVPVETRPFGQGIVASQVGLTFSPTVFAQLLETWPLLIGMAFMTIVIGFFTAAALSRMARVRYSVALIATLPTSPVEASVIAERYGFPLGPIILSQTLRIAFVVVLIPITIYAIRGLPEHTILGGYVPFNPLGNTVLALLALAGVLLFKKLHVPNPYFLGPLALASILTAAGVELVAFHPVILAAAQIIMGTWLGATFKRTLFTSAGRMISASIISSLLFILLSALTGVAIAFMLDMPWDFLVLAGAPGGVTEMALTAKFLGANVALITAFHITRIFIVVPSIPLMISLIHKYESRRPSP